MAGAVFVCGLGACAGDAPDERVLRAREAIVGGVDDEGDPAVVAVRYGFVDACTGTLIAPHTVLTAAHCTKNVAEDLWLDALLEVDFGPNSGENRKIDVRAHVEHPKFTKAGAGYDVALLTLDEAVTDIAPVALPFGITPDLTGTLVRHVGYGENDEDNESGQGHKREATYPVTRVEPLLYASGGAAAQTCEGDSGGPMLWRDPKGLVPRRCEFDRFDSTPDERGVESNRSRSQRSASRPVLLSSVRRPIKLDGSTY